MLFGKCYRELYLRGALTTAFLCFSYLHVSGVIAGGVDVGTSVNPEISGSIWNGLSMDPEGYVCGLTYRDKPSSRQSLFDMLKHCDLFGTLRKNEWMLNWKILDVALSKFHSDLLLNFSGGPAMLNLLVQRETAVTKDSIDTRFFSNEPFLYNYGSSAGVEGQANVLITDYIKLYEYTDRTLHMGLVFDYLNMLPRNVLNVMGPWRFGHKSIYVDTDSFFGVTTLQWPSILNNIKIRRGSLTLQFPSSLYGNRESLWYDSNWQQNIEFQSRVGNTLTFTVNLEEFVHDGISNYDIKYEAVKNYKWFTHEIFVYRLDVDSFWNNYPMPRQPLSSRIMPTTNFSQRDLNEGFIKANQCCSVSLPKIHIDTGVLLATEHVSLYYLPHVFTHIKLDGIWIQNHKVVLSDSKLMGMHPRSLFLTDKFQHMFTGRGMLLLNHGISLRYNFFQYSQKYDLTNREILADEDRSGISWIPFSSHNQVGQWTTNYLKQKEYGNTRSWLISDVHDQWHKDWLLFDKRVVSCWLGKAVDDLLDIQKQDDTNKSPLIHISAEQKTENSLVKVSLRGLLWSPLVANIHHNKSLWYEQLGRVFGSVHINVKDLPKSTLLQGIMQGHFLINTSNQPEHTLSLLTNEIWHYHGQFDWVENLSMRTATESDTGTDTNGEDETHQILWQMAPESALWLTDAKFGLKSASSSVTRMHFHTPEGQNSASIHFFGNNNVLRYDVSLRNMHLWIHPGASLRMSPDPENERRAPLTMEADNLSIINIWIDDLQSQQLGNIVLQEGSRLNILFSARKQLARMSNQAMLTALKLSLPSMNLVTFFNIDLARAEGSADSESYANLKVFVGDIDSTHENADNIFVLQGINSQGTRVRVPLLSWNEIDKEIDGAESLEHVYDVKRSNHKVWMDIDILPVLAREWKDEWNDEERTRYDHLLGGSLNQVYHTRQSQWSDKPVFMPADETDVAWAREKFQDMKSIMSLADRVRVQKKFWFPDLRYLQNKGFLTHVFWPQEWISIQSLPKDMHDKIVQNVSQFMGAENDDRIADLSTITPQAAHRMLNDIRTLEDYAGVSISKKAVFSGGQSASSELSIYSFLTMASEQITYFTLHAPTLLRDMPYNNLNILREEFRRMTSSSLERWGGLFAGDVMHNDAMLKALLPSLLESVKSTTETPFSESKLNDMFGNFWNTAKQKFLKNNRLYSALPARQDGQEVKIGWELSNHPDGMTSRSWNVFWNQVLYNSALAFYRNLAFYVQIYDHDYQVSHGGRLGELGQSAQEILRIVDKKFSPEFQELSNRVLAILFPDMMTQMQRKFMKHYAPMLKDGFFVSIAHTMDELLPDMDYPYYKEVSEEQAPQTTETKPEEYQEVAAVTEEVASTEAQSGEPIQTDGATEISEAESEAEIGDQAVEQTQEVATVASIPQDHTDESKKDEIKPSLMIEDIDYADIYDQLYKIQLYDSYLLQNFQNFVLNHQILDYLWGEYKRDCTGRAGVIKQTASNISWDEMNLSETNLMGMYIGGDYDFPLTDEWSMGMKINFSAINTKHHVDFVGSIASTAQDQRNPRKAVFNSDVQDLSLHVLGEYRYDPESRQVGFIFLNYGNIDNMVKEYGVDLYTNNSNLFLGTVYEQMLVWPRTSPLRVAAGGYVQVNRLSYDHNLTGTNGEPNSVTLSSAHLLAAVSTGSDFYMRNYRFAWQMRMQLHWRPDIRMRSNMDAESAEFFDLYEHMLDRDNLFFRLGGNMYISFSDKWSSQFSLSVDFSRHTRNYRFSISLQYRL